MPDADVFDATVAVATLNRPEALARCVDAILGGEVRPAELIVVDQSTSGDTGRMVARSSWHQLVRLRYLHVRSRGLSASRNAAVALARGGIVAFTDDDCVPHERWLAEIAAAFSGAVSPDAVTGRVLPLGREAPGLYAVSTRASTRHSVHRGRCLPWMVGTGGNTAVSREWLLRVGGFDERLGAGTAARSAEDLDFYYRLLLAGATVYYVPDAIVFHERQNGERRMSSRTAYGFGLGAFCAMWARRRDAYAAWMFACWCAGRCLRLLKSTVRCRWRGIREETLMLRGAAAGLGYGCSLHGGTP